MILQVTLKASGWGGELEVMMALPLGAEDLGRDPNYPTHHRRSIRWPHGSHSDFGPGLVASDWAMIRHVRGIAKGGLDEWPVSEAESRAWCDLDDRRIVPGVGHLALV